MQVCHAGRRRLQKFIGLWLAFVALMLFVLASKNALIHHPKRFDLRDSVSLGSQELQKKLSLHASTSQVKTEVQEHADTKLSNASEGKVDNISQNLRNDGINKSAIFQSLIDEERRSRKPWKQDSACQRHKVYFSKDESLPPCALASYPGSGNTWMRYLVEGASGIFTGSTYKDDRLYIRGYYGEFEPYTGGTTIAQKTHSYSIEHIKSFNWTAIVLLRNPYKAILAYHNYIFGGHDGYAPLSNFKRKDWDAFLHLQAKSWLQGAVNWVNEGRNIMIIHYEHLKQNITKEMQKTLDFLNIPADEERLKCLEIDRAIRYVDYIIKKKDLERIPLHLYEFYNETKPSQFQRVPCRSHEPEEACFTRVDYINKFRQEITVSSDNNESVAEMAVSTDNEKYEREKESTKAVNSLFGYFQEKLLNVFESPIAQKLFPSRKLVYGDDLDELTQTVRFDGDFGIESHQLSRDFNWNTKYIQNVQRVLKEI